MSALEEDEKLEFKWGKRRGVGGKRKEVKFYESFSYDGLEYTLYDCVYLHMEGEAEPYIGKLIKIWENADKSKKVKVQWFFRPFEILNWIEDGKALWNEIFLAAGEGVGLANINTLEAISGKCNVVCISNDTRNPQPSDEELKMADFVFYRTFDVQHLTISDKMDNKVGGLEVKFIFNKKENENANVAAKLDSEKKDDENNGIGQNTIEELKTQKREGYNSNLAKDVLVNRDRLTRNVNDVKKDEVKVDERVKEGKYFGDDRPSKKAKIDKCINSNKKLSLMGNDVKASSTNPNTSEEKTKSKLVKDSSVIDKGAESAKVDSSSKVPLKGKKPDEKKKVSSSKLPKASSSKLACEERETEGQLFKVTRSLDVDKRNWFKQLEIIWHAFEENCSAKMVQRTSISTPHFGEALVIFKTRDVAERVVRKLNEGCLMLSNGRALVGSTRAVDSLPGKQCTYFGHLVIDKIKLQMQKEMKDAVSTSHCSQPNTIEYEMAMEWCLLQSRSDAWWKRLYKKQGEELRKHKANLKLK